MSSLWNEETQIEESAENQDNVVEENYRHEIEDIVKGFMIEKDLLTQGHEEEISRMRVHFDRERKELMQQLEMEKDQMIEASRITDSAANEVRFAVSESYISDAHAGQLHAFSESSADVLRLNGFHQRSNGSKDLDEVDSNLIREIAEVYLRINNGALTTQMRPDLDLEDKYEKERESIERSFRLEKRELKRKLEDDCHRRLEQERIKYEGSLAEMKTTISDLQWQKRELENRAKHEREKWDMNFEREKNEIEKRHMQTVHEARRKLDEKHNCDLDKQRERYEENISDLQMDISKLTLQLKELNENLAQEKETILIKFEREVKEMEQAFIEQRDTLRTHFEAEFMVRLENETTVFKSLNIKLKEEIQTLEKEKQDLEKKSKEERRKLEGTFEEEISEIEQRLSEEKRIMKMKLEERYQVGLAREKGGLEETVRDLSEDINLLKQENAKMEIMFNERKEELQRQVDLEREEMRRTMYSERDEIRVRVENEFSQKLLLEKATQDDVFRQQERDTLILRAKCDDLEMQMSSLHQEREMLIRSKEQLEGTLRSKEAALMSTNRMFSKSDQDESRKLQEMTREKDKEMVTIKLENQQLELSLSAMRREKVDLEDEIASLKRRLSSSSEQQHGVKFGSDNSELTSVQESMRRKEGEVSSLQREKYELESRLSSLQRKNEELEDELATLRRKKLEVEDEISALKRDKTDSDNKIASLNREKGEFEDLVTTMKRKHADLEESMSAIKREKLELEHELSILKRHNRTMEIEVHRQFNDHETSRTSHHDHVTHEHITPQVTKEVHHQMSGNSLYNDVERSSDTKRETGEFERVVQDLKREKRDLESAIGRLTNEKADLEKDLRLQLEYRRKVLHQDMENSVQGNQTRGSDTEASWVLQRQKGDLEMKISALKEQQVDLENKVSQYERECGRMEEKRDELKDDKTTLENEIKTLKFEKHGVEKEIENRKKEKGEGEIKGRRPKASGIPRLKSERGHADKNPEQQIADLQQEREDLRAELTNLKRQLVLLQKELSTKTVHFSKESVHLEEKEISELKRSRMELERGFAVLRRKKTEMEAEITVVKEVKKREENDLGNLRRERMELDMQITALQSQKTRLEAEGSVLKDERKRDESEVDRLRREKVDLEKDVYGLQSDKRKLETDISVGDDAWRKKASATTGLNEDVHDTAKQLEVLQRQKEDLQSELSRFKVIKNNEEEEVKRLRQQKSDIELQLSRLQMERNLQSQKRTLGADVRRNVHEGNVGSQADLRDGEKYLEALKMQRDDLQSEISKVQIMKSNEEREVHMLHMQKSEIEVLLSSLQRDKVEIEAEVHSLRIERDTLISTRNHQQTEVEFVSSDLDRRREATPPHSYHPSHVSRQDPHLYSYNSHSAPQDFYEAGYGSHSSTNHSTFSPKTFSTNAFSSSTMLEETVKEDNDVISLKRERGEIECQISDMRIQLTKLQTDVTEMENRKTILETVHRHNTVHTLESSTVNGHAYDLELEIELDSEFTAAAMEEKRDALIQEYENQIRELKQQKLELEQKVGLLEWQLENMKQRLELQEISHRRELSALNENLSQSMSSLGSDALQAETLKVFYQKLSYFLMSGEHTSEEIMKEIEREITELAQKSNSDPINMKEFLPSSPSQKLGKEKHTSDRETRVYSSQLRAQLETADTQLKTCEKIIHRLYGENTDLNNQNVNLEGKLNAASRSQDKLHRKKALLQKLVDKLSGHVAKDVLKQSYLVLELDKDVTL